MGKSNLLAKNRNKKRVLILLPLLIIALVAFLMTNNFSIFSKRIPATSSVAPIQSEEVKTLPDGTRYIVDPSEILSGSPPKDVIPSIDNPKFISASEASWLKDDEVVFGVFRNGIAKAYPKQIMVWHEIVNDKFGDEPVLVTYCPLCGTGIAFERRLPDESEVTFGTSGKLWKSNLVMYDRKTDSYWSQVLGKAIVGPLSGTKLNILSMDTITWKEWKQMHPNTQVLSRDTGYSRPYGTDPYGDYYTNDYVGFGVVFKDVRLQPKVMISGVEFGNLSKAYPVGFIVKVGYVLNDVFAGRKLLIVQNPSIEFRPEVNSLKIFDRTLGNQTFDFELHDNNLFDKQSGSEWTFDGESINGSMKGKNLTLITTISAMWFSWLSTHPQTEVFTT